ncbi:MAG: AraC family transcriptional regulator [Chitinimonas sp.]|nr:AraC family transcriptional regulator [Chitinimonas sp.]
MAWQPHIANQLDHRRDEQGWQAAHLHGAAQTAMLFDGVPGFAYIVKDAAGRYVSFNQSVMQRVKARRPEDIRGHTAAEIWPGPMAARYNQQDQWLIKRQLPIFDQLDPTLYADGETGWCITHKYPLYVTTGELAGILCLSRDLPEISRNGLINEQLANAVDRMVIHFEDKLQIADLAEQAGLSSSLFSARIRKIYGISPADLILRSRIRAACALLRRDDAPLSQIALQCGFYDHSLLSRQFQRVIGTNPSSYRKWLQTQPQSTLVPWEPHWPR